MRYRIALALVVAFASTCVATAIAQHTSVNPDRSRAGRILESAPLSFQGATLHDPLWTLEAPRSIDLLDANETAVGDGAVFFGKASATGAPLFALDEHSGKKRWTSAVRMSSLTYADGFVYGVSADTEDPMHARVTAVDARTGHVQWSMPGGSIAIVGSQAIVANHLHLEARDARSGKLQWRAGWSGYPIAKAERIGPALLLQSVESGAVTATIIRAFDARDGRAFWTVGTGIVGVLPSHEVVLNTTWAPRSAVEYAPLTTVAASLSSGAWRSLHAYAPDTWRWSERDDHDVPFAQDAVIDGDALVFRIGPTTVYRYARDADPDITPPVRYELGPLSRIAPGTWLAHLSDDTAAFAQLGPTHATVRHLTGLGAVQLTGASAGFAFVVGRNRAAVFYPGHPSNALVTRFPCNVVVRAFVADHALILVCGDETSMRLVALALPGERAPIGSASHLMVHGQPWHPFNITMHTFAVPGTVQKTIRGAAFAADGTLWFCEHEEASNNLHTPSDFIGHLRSDGTIEEFPVPTVGAHVDAISPGRDGAMWFTEAAAVKIGRISPNGKIVEYALPPEFAKSPTTFSDPQLRKLGGLVIGPDGILWVTVPYAHALVRMTTSGVVRAFRLSDLTYPGAITRGPDGALWFDAGRSIGRITVRGEAMLFPIPEKPELTSVIWGPDGNVWFSAADGRIGRTTPRGAMRIFPAQATAAPGGPLIGGCDGALYIADYARPKLWRITVTGEFTPRDIAYRIGNLARAPDCTLGFTESRGRHLGTISLGPHTL